MLNNDSQNGFTLIEIVAVLTLIGVLAAIALSKYMELVEDTRTKAVIAQFAELSGRLKVVDAGFQLKNFRRPDNGQELLTYAELSYPSICPINSTVEGDFIFSCRGDNSKREVTISFSGFQSTTFSPALPYVFLF